MKELLKRFTHAELLGIISAIVVFVGSFLPQVKRSLKPENYEYFKLTFGIGNEYSWLDFSQGYTILILILLVVFALAITYFCNRYYRKSLSAIFMIAIGITITSFKYLEIPLLTISYNTYFYEFQIGIYLTILGGIGLIVSGLWLLFTPGKEKIYVKMGNIFSAIAFLLGIIIFSFTVYWMGPFIVAMSPKTAYLAMSFESYIGGWVFLFLSPLLMCTGIIDYLASRKYLTVEEAVEKVRQYEQISEDENAMKILKVRYVKNEITKEEYEQMKKDIEQ